MGWLVLVIVVLFIFVFFRFTIVDEGTAKAIMTLGKFSWIIFRWEKHWMDKEGTIWRDNELPDEKKPAMIDGETLEHYEKRIKPLIRKFRKKNERKQRWPFRILGGWYFYGIWLIQKVHQYIHRWTDIRLRETGKVDLEFHEEARFNHVLLKPAVYAFKLEAVETKPPERIPVGVLVLVTLKIVNPYLFLFVAPPTPMEDVLARISAETRALVTSCLIDKLLQLKGESLWDLLTGAKVIEDTLGKWGMKLAKKGVEIRDIDLPPEYQKAAAAKRAEELKAAGRAEEIRGTVISAVARSGGKSEKKVQAEFWADPKAFYRKHKPIVDDTMTKLSMEEGAYLRMETPGATGFGGEFLRLIGAAKRMPMGKKTPPEKEGVEETEEEKDRQLERLLEERRRREGG